MEYLFSAMASVFKIIAGVFGILVILIVIATIYCIIVWAKESFENWIDN